MRRLIVLLCLALPATAQAGAGGAPSVPPPSATAVKCVKNCTEDGMAKKGSRVVVRGTQLTDAASVEFAGTALAGDEATAKPKVLNDAKLRVKVPRGAVTGPLVVTDAYGQASAPSPELAILAAKTPKRTDGPIATALSGRKTFVDGHRRPTLSYRLQTSAAAHVTVSVVKVANGKTVKTFDEGMVDAGAGDAVVWDGTRQGRYAFVVSAVGEDGARASTAQGGSPDTFVLLGHKFPIRGKHEFGTGAAAFGGGRGHQGQDIFAECGTPLVAARGGRVKMRKFQSRAGNYLVIDDAGEGVDTMYAHLRDPALVHKGDRVHTGDPIGYVGDTGDADGCHLHFEEWSAPGWYTGGSPFDPLPDLKAWDALS